MKTKMLKILALLLATLMILGSLVACSGGIVEPAEPQGKNDNNSDPEEQANKDEQGEQINKGSKSEQSESRFCSGDYVYILSSSNQATIVSYVGDAKTVIVPSEIDGYPITAIGDKTFFGQAVEDVTLPEGINSLGWAAFQDCVNLKQIELPDSIKSIGIDCFHNCASLTDIKLPNQLETLDTGAFGWCCSIKEIVIPDSVRRIDSSAFARCHSLRKITIGKNVTEFGDLCFESCFRLTEIINLSSVNFPGMFVSRMNYGGEYVYSEEDGVNRFFTTEDGFVFYRPDVEYDQSYYLIGYEGDSVDIVLPNNFNGEKYDIHRSAFAEDDVSCGCKKINSVIIPDGAVDEIWSIAFLGCTELKNVYLGSGISYLWSASFKNCTSLKEIKIPNSVLAIVAETFSGCDNLSKLEFEVQDSWYLQHQHQWEEDSFYVTTSDPETNAKHLVTAYFEYTWRRDYRP